MEFPKDDSASLAVLLTEVGLSLLLAFSVVVGLIEANGSKAFESLH